MDRVHHINDNNNNGIHNWQKMASFRRELLPERVEVDLLLVNDALRRKGMSKLRTKELKGLDRQVVLDRMIQLTEGEKEYIGKKNLTPLQFKLRVLMDKMLSDVLWEEKEQKELYGGKMKVSGLSFKGRMLHYPTLAEKIFCEWAEVLGIGERYHSVTPPYDVGFSNENPSVYKRFCAVLTILI